MSNHDIPVEEIGQLLDTIATRLPKVFQAIRDSVFSPEAGTEIGTSVGNFYKALVDKGIPEEKALELTTEYLNTMKAIGRQMNMGGKGRD